MKISNFAAMRQLCDRHDLTFGSSGFSACSEMPVPFNNDRSQARTHKATILHEGGNALPCVELVKVVRPSSAASFRPPHPVPVLTKIQSVRRVECCSLRGNVYWKSSLLAISCNLELTIK